MISTMNTNVTNALLRFYAHSKSKEEAEKLIEYIDALVNCKSQGNDGRLRYKRLPEG